MTIQVLLPGIGEGEQGHNLRRDVVQGITFEFLGRNG